jgi:hypothetical protein
MKKINLLLLLTMVSFGSCTKKEEVLINICGPNGPHQNCQCLKRNVLRVREAELAGFATPAFPLGKRRPIARFPANPSAFPSGPPNHRSTILIANGLFGGPIVVGQSDGLQGILRYYPEWQRDSHLDWGKV